LEETKFVPTAEAQTARARVPLGFMIEATNLTKAYGEKRAVTDISFEVRPGRRGADRRHRLARDRLVQVRVEAGSYGRDND
jgi:hypothetical protein